MFSKILRFIGILLIIYWLLLCFYIGFDQGFSYFWLIAGLILVFFGLMSKVIKITILTLIIVFLITGTFVEIPIIKEAINTPAPDAAYMIVLGAKADGEEPSKVLKSRLDSAVSYLSVNPNTTVIVSGGKGRDEEYTESYVMKKYLVEKGIDSNQILTEDKASNTRENIEFSKEIIGNTSLETVIVTSDFHMYRALKTGEECGFNHLSGMCADTELFLVPDYYIREIFAVIKNFSI